MKYLLTGLIGLALLIILFIGYIGWFETTHHCTQYGPYYTIYRNVGTAENPVIVPERLHDCVGEWVNNQ